MSKRRRRKGGARNAVAPVQPRSAELGQVIATTGDGRDITRPFVQELEEFRDKRLAGVVDWGVYDRILLDDQVKSCLEQRRSAVVSREWSVIPGDPEDPRSVAAAEALEANLLQLDWDDITDKMLYARFYGIAVAELVWKPVNGQFFFDIHVRHARRFRYDRDRRLRLITVGNMRGEILDDRKFWVVTAGASDSDEPYGRGLAEWLYWPCLFKRNAIRFWNLFLDKFSLPTAKGKYRPGATKEEIGKVLQAIMSIANETGFAIPEGMEVEFMQIASAGIDFEKMPRYMDEAIAKIILSQTMTTQDGSSLSQAQVHKGVQNGLITADADLTMGSFNRGPSRWFTDFNYGPNVASPIVIRHVEEEEDLKHTAETDAVLERIGWQRTEESFKDIYGDGFVRKAAPEPAPVPPAIETKKPANDDDQERPRPKVAVSFAEAPIGGDIVDHAVAQIMADEGWRSALDIDPLIEALTRASSPAEVEEALIRHGELADDSWLTESLARAGFAVRYAAAAGEDGRESLRLGHADG